MIHDERAIQERLKEMRLKVEQACTELEREAHYSWSAIEYQAMKARNVANEALAEIRHLEEQFASLTTAASPKPSPGTRRATAPSRSRGRRV